MDINNMKFKIGFIVHCVAVLVHSQVDAAKSARRNGVTLIERSQDPLMDASISLFPYHVSIETSGEIVCEGAIISVNHVLTAASCKKNRITQYLVRAGTSLTKTGGSLHNVDEFIAHAEREGKNIAIMHVIEPFVISNFQKPVALIEAGVQIKPPSVLDITSFSDTHLQYITVPVMNGSSCKKRQANVSECTLCADFDEHDACFELVGTPLTVNLQLVGIMTGEFGCGRGPGVFTEVAPFREWIRKIAQV